MTLWSPDNVVPRGKYVVKGMSILNILTDYTKKSGKMIIFPRGITPRKKELQEACLLMGLYLVLEG